MVGDPRETFSPAPPHTPHLWPESTFLLGPAGVPNPASTSVLIIPEPVFPVPLRVYGCCLRVSATVTSTMENGSWGGKVLFGLHFSIAVHYQRKSDQELKHGRFREAGTYAEATEENCLLACFPWLTQPGFLEFLEFNFHYKTGSSKRCGREDGGKNQKQNLKRK